MLMNVESVNQQEPCFICETKGTGITSGFSGKVHSCINSCITEKNPVDDGLVVFSEQNFDIQKSLNTAINHQYDENQKNNSLPHSSTQPSEISFVECNTSSQSFNNKAIESVDSNLIKESEQDVTELDVERVLEKQDTHDLFCPNCNSCITRRVIIRKRKPRIHISSEDSKRNKLETVVDPELDVISEQGTNDQGHNAVDDSLTPEANEHDRDREPDIFRCLSCFTFFIPTGNGFKLFRTFGDKSEKENMQDPEQMSAMKKNWFSSIFASDKGETFVEQGSVHRVGLEENSVEASIPSSNLNDQDVQPLAVQGASSTAQTSVVGGPVKSRTTEHQEVGDDTLPSSTVGSTAFQKVTVDVGEKVDDAMKKSKGRAVQDNLEIDTVNQLDSLSFSNEVLPNHEIDPPVTKLADRAPINRGECAENATLIPQQDGLKPGCPSNVDSIVLTKSQTEQKLKVAIQEISAVSVHRESVMVDKVNISVDIPCDNEQNAGATLITGSTTDNENAEVKIRDKDQVYHSEVSQHTIMKTKVDAYTDELSKAVGDSLIPSAQDSLLLQERQVNSGKFLKVIPTESVAAKDTVITFKAGPIGTAASQTEQNTIFPAEMVTSPQLETQIHVVEKRSAEPRDVHGLEIIKSIIYGGLIEAITSLGVVSSAAGADAVTLNVLALGLANLIGGLFIIGHDLWELKSSHSGVASNQGTEQVDRYQKLLGRRENFLLHATVAVLSFLIFGLVPPIIYGFSFRTSDNKELKLGAVAAASLLCIFILSAGKAYVQSPPKSYLKTVVYYVSLGFMVSGVSYVIGSLIKKLLEELGLFQSSLVVTLPLVETRSMKPAWASS